MPQRPALHEDLTRTNEVEHSSDRAFGLVFAAVFALLSLWPVLDGSSPRLWAGGLAVAFAAVALVVPTVLHPLNRVWMWIGSVLHRIVSPVVLAALFFGVVWPTGMVMRLFGKHTIPAGPEPDLDSYWIPRDPPGPSPDGMKNQF